MSKVQHLHSRVTTMLEASRLVRHQVETLAHEVFWPHAIDADTLLGACGVASYVLSRVLKRVGIKCDFVMGRFGDITGDRGSHCWVEIPKEGLILDVTATQFDIPSAVHVTSDEDGKYHPRFRNRKAVEELKEWGGQSHLVYKDELDRVVGDVTKQLFQDLFVAYA